MCGLGLRGHGPPSRASPVEEGGGGWSIPTSVKDRPSGGPQLVDGSREFTTFYNWRFGAFPPASEFTYCVLGWSPCDVGHSAAGLARGALCP